MTTKDKRTKVDLTEEQKATLQKFLSRYTHATQRKAEAEESLHDLCVLLAGEGYTLNIKDGVALFKA